MRDVNIHINLYEYLDIYDKKTSHLYKYDRNFT